MANADVPQGLVPAREIGPGRLNRYHVPSSDGTALFLNDLVKLHGNASADGYPTVIQAAAGSSTNIHIGVVVGFDPIYGVTPGSENFHRAHRLASTAMYARVCDDPDMLFLINCSATLAATDIGQNADIVVAAGSTVTGISGMELDTTTIATTATLPLKIKGIINSPDNVLGANTKALVQINSHVGKFGTVGL